MTGRPGHWTMEMNGGSSAPYLACTPYVPLFVHCLIRVEAEGFLDYQGRAGIISIVRWNLRPVTFGVETRVGKGSGRGRHTAKIILTMASKHLSAQEAVLEVLR